MTQRLIDALTASGADVRLVDRRFSRTVDEVGKFSGRKIWAGLSLWLRVGSAALGRPRWVVVFGTNRPASFIVDVGVFRILSLLRRPTLNYVHTMGYAALAARGDWWRRQVRFTLTSPERVVVLGRSLLADVEGARQVSVIPNAAPQTSGRKLDRNTVLFLANLIPEKGAGDFLSMAKRLTGVFPQMQWVIAGADVDGQESLLRSEASAFPQIFVAGRVDSAERDKLLASTHTLVFPSRYPYEAQPLSIIEAQSMGIPTVAYDVGGIADVINESNGILLPQAEVELLTQSVERLLSDPALHASLAAGAQASFRDHHSLEAFAFAWSELLLSAANDRVSRNHPSDIHKAAQAKDGPWK
jgi:glycosyltransferase involved in cell wall biosynthesis